MSTAARYDLESPVLPRLVGRALRLATWLLEHPATRWVLLGRLLRVSGIRRLRDLIVEDLPSFQPFTSWDIPTPKAEVASVSTLLSLMGKPRENPTGLTRVTDYHQAYESGAATPEEVAQRVLTALADSEAHIPPLRLFSACSPADVMAQAQASGQRWRAGKPLSVFDGVPVAIKDELDQLPYGTTLGTRFLGRTPPTVDATIVARLRRAGALLLGKTNMHELGAGISGLNPHYGVVRNPYHPGHYSGGSSSGSAAAVAAGLCPVAIGTDAGGSIRIPAAFCGVVGLKPTHGRVSGFGTLTQGLSMCQAGPLAATAQDAALAYAVIAGPDTKDRKSLIQPPVSLRGFDNLDLSGLSLGVYRPWFEHATAPVVECCDALVRQLKKRGARVKEVTLPELDAGRVAHAITVLAEMAAALEPHYDAHRRDLGEETRIHLVLGRALTALDYLQAQRIRTRMTAHWFRALQDADVVVTPATACAAPPILVDALPRGESDLARVTTIMRFAFPANFTGLPAVTFPAGYDADGLPIGLQAIGRPWEEHVLLRLAHVAEHLVERRAAPVSYRVLASRPVRHGLPDSQQGRS